MDHRYLQAVAHRLVTALRIAEANEGHNPGVHAEAVVRARGYVQELEVALDKGRWVCPRCRQELPADVGSCSSCQAQVVAQAKERAG